LTKRKFGVVYEVKIVVSPDERSAPRQGGLFRIESVARTGTTHLNLG